MAEIKEHDIFMDLASNPGASVANLMVGAGLNAKNTSIQNKEVYKNDPWVKELFKNDFGEFDEVAFNNFYDNAKASYNYLANSDYNQAMKDLAVFHRNNMIVSPDLKQKEPMFFEYKTANPYQITQSAFTLGIGGERTKSVDEIAQSYRVLLNPTTAGDDLSNADWGDAPNDSIMGSKYWLDTLVLAQYDLDGEYTNLFTGEKEFHKKGELKTDDLGNFYYEKLDGRNVYGRRVLNKLNVLTVDGSWINQYDFFDSDDLNLKSIGGSIMKNLALVGTMFIPYVGPWIAGLSVATQMVGVFGTLSKMLTGSDNAFLSELEGWSKSVNRLTAKTEYAQENTWCWENFIDLIGDVMGQLKEQRFVFEKVPVLFKGNTMITKANEVKRYEELLEKELKLLGVQIDNLRKNSKSVGDALKAMTQANDVAALTANAKMRLFNESFQSIGHVLGRSYMTAITVGDTYGEAKHAGATDFEATMLTLGYAAGEYAILSTGIGEWFFPEVRDKGLRYKYIAETLSKYKMTDEAKVLFDKFGNTATKEGKKAAAKKLFDYGKNIAKATYVDGSRGVKASLAAAIGESVEEVSEELLADFSKGCYNTVQFLRGEDTRLDSFGFSWEEGQRSWDSKDLIDRYGMSAVGGFIGGGLTNAGTNYGMIKNYKKMDSNLARQELVYMARNGELPEFVKSLKKMLIGNPNIDPLRWEVKDGITQFMPGNENNNQDLYIKHLIEQECKTIDAFLKAEGGLPDNTFLNKMVLEELRFNTLLKSSTAGMYLQEYNTLLSQLLQNQALIDEKLDSVKDTNNNDKIEDREERKYRSREELISKLSDADKTWVQETEAKIKDIRSKISDLLEGKRSYEFIRDATFEMTEALSGRFTALGSYALYIQAKYGRNIDDLTDEEKQKTYEEYETLRNTEGREKLRAISQLFAYVMELANSVLKNSTNDYLSISKNMRAFNNLVSNLYLSFFQVDSEGELYKPLELQLKNAQELTKNTPGYTLKFILGYLANPNELTHINQLTESLYHIDPALSSEDLAKEKARIEDEINKEAEDLFVNKVNEIIKPFLDLGFIEYEVKQLLLELLETVKKPILENFNNIENLRKAYLDQNYPIPTEDDVKEVAELIPNDWELPYILLTKAIDQIDKLTYTPLQLNLAKFLTSIGINNPINVLSLIEKVNTLFEQNAGDITSFTLGKTLSDELDLALAILNLYEAAITASRVDNVDVENVFGYSVTLNEVAKKLGENRPELAEIDFNTANLFIEDIKNTRTKLEFLTRLYKINQGQKLGANDRVAVNKDLLLYQRLKYIVNVPPDDPLRKEWKDFDKFEQALLGLIRHNELILLKKLTIDKDIEDEYYKEDLQFKNAVYEFIQANRDEIINNPAKLMLLINPSKLLLYTTAGGLLTEFTQALDDNAFVWLLATMGAVKAEDFYKEFASTIETQVVQGLKTLAPIATHEMAVYTNYASIVDPELFKSFYIAYRQSVKEHWKSITDPNERMKILKNLGKDSRDLALLSSTDLDDYCLNFLTTPKYTNIILTEGIPGAGKTASVFYFTKQLLLKYHPELLENALVVSGIDSESSEDILKNLKITNGKALDMKGLMTYIDPNWTEYTKDSDGNYEIPDTGYILDSDKLMRVNATVAKPTSNVPKIIFIDEISKFNAYDVDRINKFALENNIIVIAAGDFDLMGVYGAHKVNNVPLIKANRIELNRTDFIRTPKLGVSMRTSNSLKSTNLSALQMYKQNPQNTLDLLYYEDNKGLHGDRVISYAPGDLATVIAELKAQIKTLIKTLLPNEKIGYIYDNENSPIYQALMAPSTDPNEPNIKDFLELKKGGSAQGKEAQYYIVEGNTSLDLKEYLDLIYTGMSRAKQGSIIITQSNYRGTNFNAIKNNENIEEPLPESAIIGYATRRKQTLEKISLNGQPVLLRPRSKTTTNLNGQGNNPPPSGPLGPSNPPSGPTNQPPGNNPPGNLPPSGGSNTRTPINLSTYPFNLGDKIDVFDSDGNKITTITIKEAYKDLFGNKLLVEEENGNSRILNLDAVNAAWDNFYKPAVSPNSTANLVELSTPIISNILDIIDDFNLYYNIVRGVNKTINYLNKDNDLTLEDIDDIVEVLNETSSGLGVDILTHFPNLLLAIDKKRKQIIDSINDKNQRHNQYLNLILSVSTLKELRALENTYSLDGTFDEFEDLQEIVKQKRELLEQERKSKVLSEISYATTINELEKILQDNEVDTDVETEIVKAYQDKVLSLQQIEESKYYENLLNDTGMSLASQEEYEANLDEKNETKELPESEAVVTKKKVKISMLIHTFNSFELGVKVGPDMMAYDIDGMPGSMEKRIDSINGLQKVDNYLGKSRRTVPEYIEILGDLRKAIYNTADKSELIEKLQKILGLSNILCTFGFKISASSGDSNIQNNRRQVSQNLHPLDKSYEENSLYNYSTDSRSHEIHKKSLVLVISTDETGNILELPLAALSNPFTLLEVRKADFSEPLAPIRNRFEQLLRDPNYWNKDRNGNIIYKQNGEPEPNLYKIANTLYEELKNQEEYEEIADLFRLYTINDNAIFFIDEDTWTFAGALNNEGPVVITTANGKKKGYYQLIDGFVFDEDTNPREEWVELNNFAKGEIKGHLETIGLRKNPVCSVTKRIMVSTDGQLVKGTDIFEICNPSHPFVLVSYADDLIDDSDIIDYFIKYSTKEPGYEIPKVKLMYVLPPRATLKEYFENLYELYNSTSEEQRRKNVVPIGTITTSYEMIKRLMKSDDFKRRLEEKKSGAVAKIEEALRLLEGLSDFDLVNALKSKQDWSSEVNMSKQAPKMLAGIFDELIYNVVYSVNKATETGLLEIVFNESDFNIVESVLKAEGINGVYYHAILSTDMEQPAGIPFLYPLQGDNYTLGGKPFMIHGKIDLPTFKGHLADIIHSMVKKDSTKLKVNGTRADGLIIWGSTDTDSRYYKMSNGQGLFVNASKRKQRQPIRNNRQARLETLLERVVKYTARALATAFEGRTPYLKLLTPEEYFENVSYELGLSDLINDINNYSNRFAFSISGSLFILDGRGNPEALEIFKSDLNIVDSNGNIITDLSTLMDNNGNVLFIIQYDGNKEINVEYDKSMFKFTYPSVQTTNNISITSENFTNYIESGKRLLGEILNPANNKEKDPYLIKMFNATTFDEFMETANKMVFLKRRNQKLDALNPTTAEELQLIQDLKALNQNAESRKDGTCQISSFKISLI